MSDNKKFTEEVLKATNDYRRRHNADPLLLNEEISKVSQRWAKHLADTNTMEHNPSAIYNQSELGENIAMKYSSSNAVYTGYHAVDQWYKEIKDYSFKNHSGPKTGHFTQLVWRGSKEMGVGRAQAANGTWMVVANYYPPGNYIGRNKENVFPPSDGRTTTLYPESEHSDHTAKGATGGTNFPQVGKKVEVREETTGSGSSAVTKIITTETTTGHDGKTTIQRKEEIKKGGGERGAKVGGGSRIVPITFEAVEPHKSSNSGSRGRVCEKSVSRNVHQELIRSGQNYNIKITVVEKRTEADGSVSTSKKEEVRPATADEIKSMTKK